MPNMAVEGGGIQETITKFSRKVESCGECVANAKRFSNRVLAALRQAPFIGQYKFNKDMYKDLEWFIKFAEKSNGIFLLPIGPRRIWEIECDSTLLAGGAFSKDEFYAVEYPQSVLNDLMTITQLEALNLVHAFKLLLPNNPQDFRVRINTDNATSQQVLASGFGRDPVLCACARQICLITAEGNFEFEILHKPGVELVLADNLSRQFGSSKAKKEALEECRQRNLSEISVPFSVNILDDFI